MKLQIATIAAAVLTALCWWPSGASASCQGCLPGYECFIPDGDYHRGYCVPVVPPEEALGTEQTCLCENDGRLREEVKLFPCPCFTPSEEPWRWHWKGLSEHMQSLEPHEVSELLKQHGERMKGITDWGINDFADWTNQTKGLQQCD